MSEPKADPAATYSDGTSGPPPAAVYCDGGVVFRNPSPFAGTYAWCWVTGGEMTRSGSGLVPVTPDWPQVSNNVTELVALVRAVGHLPDGWAGTVFTDSGVTLARFKNGRASKFDGVPHELRAELFRHRDRLPDAQVVLLGGHPNKAELESGTRKDGKPTSPWNVWCDAECSRLAVAYLEANPLPKGALAGAAPAVPPEPAAASPAVTPVTPVTPPPADPAGVTLHYGDCITGMQNMPAECIDLIVTSIPFEELFTYSGKPEDVGNNGSTVDIREGRFALNMRFVAAAAERVMRPGTNFCCHIQQLLAYKNQHGFMGRRDFRGAMVDVFGAAGLLFTGEFVIPKCPQQMAQRLNLHSLQFKTGYARDGNLLKPAVNDYVLIFSKPGKHPTPPLPLRHAKNPGGWVTQDEWVKWASGVWDDVLEIDVLDGARGHKEQQQEKHVCPLQLSVIERLVRLYTNPASVQPDVTVLDPFAGIGSTGYVCVGGRSPVTGAALKDPRGFIGFELKESYYKAGLHYLDKATRRRAAKPDMFAGVA